MGGKEVFCAQQFGCACSVSTEMVKQTREEGECGGEAARW